MIMNSAAIAHLKQDLNEDFSIAIVAIDLCVCIRVPDFTKKIVPGSVSAKLKWKSRSVLRDAKTSCTVTKKIQTKRKEFVKRYCYFKEKSSRLSNDVVTCDVDRDVSTANCLFFFRLWGRVSTHHLCAVVLSCDWMESTTVNGTSFESGSLCGPLQHGSSTLPGLWDLNSTFPVNVVWMKSYINCLFYLVCVEMGITINKLYFVPGRAASGVVGMLWDGGGLS